MSDALNYSVSKKIFANRLSHSDLEMKSILFDFISSRIVQQALSWLIMLIILIC